MNPNKPYKALLEGKISKAEFLRQIRQGLPTLIGSNNSFDDAVSILRSKGMISEELVQQNKADKFPLEAIERGIRYELEKLDVFDIHHPSQEQYKKARQTAIDNLCKDPLYYINLIAKQTPQPKEEEDDKMKKVKNLQEGRYVQEDKDLAMHKDVDMKADVGSGEEAPVAKKVRAAREIYKDNHDWTVNEYKIAYILAEFGKKGLAAVFAHFGTPASNATLKLLANNIIGTTDAGLEFAIQGMKKVILGEKDTEWLQSYFSNSKSLEAYNALNGKSFDECIASLSLSKDTCSEEEAAEARNAQEKIDKKKNDRTKEASEATKAIIGKISDRYKLNRESSIKAAGGDKVKGEKLAFLGACQMVGYGKDNNEKRAIAWAYLRGKLNMSSQASAELDKKFGIDSKNVASFKTRNLAEANSYEEISKDPVYVQFYQHYLKKAKAAKDVNAEKTARSQAKKAFVKFKEKQLNEHKERAILKESIIGIIGKVLNEAATANLAALSDENASVAELPGIVNSLENIVTEIESFWIKEQQKIQGVFDQIGNIKNDDNLPIGYKFVQPILDSLKKDLEPVLAKITLDDLKLPEAPAPDQTQVNDPNAAEELPPVPEKETVFSPAKRAEAPLQESSTPAFDQFKLERLIKKAFGHQGVYSLTFSTGDTLDAEWMNSRDDGVLFNQKELWELSPEEVNRLVYLIKNQVPYKDSMNENKKPKGRYIK